MKDLNCVSAEEQKQFFDSFDNVLCDVDGVVWHFPYVIPGGDSAITSLKNLNKKVIFVSNNTTNSCEVYFENLKSNNFVQNQNDIVMPEVALISHLKKNNFSREIYLIGMSPLREALIKAGFKVAEFPPNEIEESVPTFLQMSLNLSDKIGAVIIDIDVNINYLKLQKAAKYLERSEVLFLSGNSSCRYLNVRSDQKIFNSVFFDNILEKFTGRKALRLAKPSPDYNDFIKEKYAIKDSSRVLFIGDSIEDDMAFAANCGYQKLLVLSGNTPKDALINWNYPEDYKPEYYVTDLKMIGDILKKIKV